MTISEDKNYRSTNETKAAIPKEAFDTEYGTMERREYEFLLEKGFKPTFIKVTKPFNVRVYKYKKTADLFQAVSYYYYLKEALTKPDAVKPEVKIIA